MSFILFFSLLMIDTISGLWINNLGHRWANARHSYRCSCWHSFQAPQTWGLESVGPGFLDKGWRRCWTEASQLDFYLQPQLLRWNSTLVFFMGSMENWQQQWSAGGVGELLVLLPNTIRTWKVSCQQHPLAELHVSFQTQQMLAPKWGWHIHFTPSLVEAILSRTAWNMAFYTRNFLWFSVWAEEGQLPLTKISMRVHFW